jgi:FkbM family methyltransferase
MRNIPRPAPFVLVSSNHGSMIVNRNDYNMADENNGYGVGYQIMNESCFDQEEVDFALALLDSRRLNFGPGVVALDAGANIGVHTIEWARLMHRWGYVHAFEAQERLYYALAGNVALNNCLNASAHYLALGGQCTQITIPEPNYLIPSSFGSLSIKSGANNEFIGQEIDYAKAQKKVTQVTIDSLKYARVDFIKLDVEGMEEEVLGGAAETIKTCKPIIIVETIKSDREKIARFLTSKGYNIYPMGINTLAAHQTDPVSQRLKTNGRELWLT